MVVPDMVTVACQQRRNHAPMSVANALTNGPARIALSQLVDHAVSMRDSTVMPLPLRIWGNARSISIPHAVTTMVCVARASATAIPCGVVCRVRSLCAPTTVVRTESASSSHLRMVKTSVLLNVLASRDGVVRIVVCGHARMPAMAMVSASTAAALASMATRGCHVNSDSLMSIANARTVVPTTASCNVAAHLMLREWLLGVAATRDALVSASASALLVAMSCPALLGTVTLPCVS